MAAEKPDRLLTELNSTTDDFLCRALRGETAPWPPGRDVAEPEFLERCRHHGIAPLLFHAMRERDEWQDWPPDIREGLEQDSRAAVARDMLRTHHLQRLLGCLAERDIPCIVLKGEALALSVYTQPGTRTRSDSDLFIRIGDIARVHQAVLDLGYRVATAVYKSRQFTVLRPEDDSYAIRFDIHWRISNAPRFARAITFDEAFERSVGFPGAAPARMLASDDALVLACLHRFGSERHDRNRLIWIHDIDALIRSMDDTALEQFANLAVQRKVQDVCLDALHVSETCFQTPVPPAVVSMLNGPVQRRSLSQRFSQSQLGLFCSDWKELDCASSRAELLKELLVPSSQFLLYKYNKRSKWWLPVLYIRQVVGGFFSRLTLR